MKKKDSLDLAKTTELEQRIGELTAGWQRTQADFINYKKQVAEDRVRLIENASTDLIGEILPVFDNFELAAKHVPDDLKNNNWAIGITMIEKQLFEVLQNAGLSRIESMGSHFDPELHEALDEIISDKPEGEVVEEVAAGYRFGDRVIRPAKVKVSGKKDEKPV